MPKIAILFVLLLFLGCESKKDLSLGIEGYVPPKTTCKIIQNARSDGQNYIYTFLPTGLQNIQGFNDFDTFQYENGKIVSAFHTSNKNAMIYFGYDTKGLLNKITFEGKDSQGRFFSYPTTITRNNIDKIDKLILTWPTFDGKVETKFTYDINGNIRTISAFLDYEWKTILENTEYDDKTSPYKNQDLGQILSYYMIYSILSGGNNFTYYINTNNVKASTVYEGTKKITYAFDYVYNTNGYPTEMSYTKTTNNRPTQFYEKFSYDCDQ